MTLSFPTHQVITTLSSSRKAGDWGLKRPLPLKSTTRSSNPMLRIKAIDTIEQITDFTSATDHGITLRKFQELGIPITARRPADGSKDSSPAALNLPQKSVFESDIDKTDIPPKQRVNTVDRRWKFTGPWLAGMTQGEFDKWLVKEVRPRRRAFRRFLKTKIAKDMHTAALQSALDKGEQLQADPIDAESVTDDQLIDYLRMLRHNNQDLYDMVGRFLDLAPIRPPSLDTSSLQPGSKVDLREPSNPYAEHGPPVTHPSAGLSYLRTSMYMENHPIYGPQKDHAPVQARVLTPRRPAQARPAMLGVAGFVATTPLGDTVSNIRSTSLLDKVDPSVVGGGKVWMRVQKASVDSEGRMVVTLLDASLESKLVAQELLGEAACLGVQRAAEARAKPESATDIRKRYSAPTMSSAQGYGFGPSE